MKKKCIKCQKLVVCSDLCRGHFIDYFENKVRKTISKFQLMNHHQKIAVAVSGGKDSTVCLYILNKLGYKPLAITIDAVIGNYTKENVANITEFCKQHNIELKVISFRDEFGKSLCYLKSALNSKGFDYSSCMVCGVLRRFLLNKYAKQLKIDVLCTGHNLDDEAQAFLMNIFRNDIQLAKRQGPVSGSGASVSFVKRVKPLYLSSEKEVIVYSKLMKFPVKYGRCPCCVGAYRKNFRTFLDKFEKDHPDVKYKIVQFFLGTLHTMKSGVSGAKPCIQCGEPASNDICKTCQILNVLKE